MSIDPILSPTESMGVTGHVQALKLGVTRRQFDYWSRQGLIYDDEHAIPGTGFPRRGLRKSEVEQLRIMAELVKGGVSPQVASRLARELRKKGTASLGSFTITRTNR